jgi:periodic tryptophan protein 1
MSDPDGQDIENDDDMPSQYSDSEEDKEDFTIRKSDSLIVAATAENDHSSLEVYLYDHKNSDLYVHHEILLGSYPLCLEWLSNWNENQTNHVIVGTFLPEIEIWNLDAESVEPTAVLGSLEKSESAKGGSMIKEFHKTGKGEDIGTHTEAVMCLSLNPL